MHVLLRGKVAFTCFRPMRSHETIDFLLSLDTRYVLVDDFTAYHEQFVTEDLPAILRDDRVKLVRCFPDSIGPVHEVCLFELHS